MLTITKNLRQMRTLTMLVLASLLLFNCSKREENETEWNNESTKTVSSYDASQFVADNRLQIISDLKDSIESILLNHGQSRHIPGVSFGIVVDDSLVFTTSYGLTNQEKSIQASSKSAFRIASMSKSFTAMSILKLRDEGKLRLSDPAAHFIPELKEIEYLTTDATPITIENLLTMTAGFPEDNPWGDRQLDAPDAELIEMVKNGISFSNIPSFEYEYSNLGYALLGHIVSKVSGMPYQEYITKNIFIPLGMTHTSWEYSEIPENLLAIGYRWENDQYLLEPMLHDGSYGAMGGIITTIEDFSKYVSFHLSAWPPRNDDEPSNLVKRSTVREMHRQTFPRLMPSSTDINNQPCPLMIAYGYGLRTSRDCNQLYSVAHGGALPGFGSNYVFYPEYGVGIMAFGNLTYTGPLPTAEIERLLFSEHGLVARKLPLSNILKKRKDEILNLIFDWDQAESSSIFAENFFLDRSFDYRKNEINALLEQAGEMLEVTEVIPLNQLRMVISMKCKNGIIKTLITLNPEPNPLIQQLSFHFEAFENN